MPIRCDASSGLCFHLPYIYLQLKTTPAFSPVLFLMAFVVTESCIKCKYTDCVEVCPVDCFHEGPNMLVIDPEDCIDCAMCETECPVNAIVSEDDLPETQYEFLTLNEKLAARWPVITSMISAPEDAGEWKSVANKRQYLEE